MSLPRQNCILKCGIKHSSCVNFLKKTQEEKITFAVKNKICLVCLKPKESSVQLSAKSKCQCDLVTSCLRKTNCQKTCFTINKTTIISFVNSTTNHCCMFWVYKKTISERNCKKRKSISKTLKKTWKFHIFYQFYTVWWKILHGAKIFCSWVLVRVNQNYWKV